MDNLLTLLELTDLRPILGDRIRTQRERMGLTQLELAPDMGITSQALGMIESGKRWPQYGTLQAAAERLGVDIEYFFAEVEAKPLEPTPLEALEVLRKAITQPKETKESGTLGQIIVALRRVDQDQLPGILDTIQGVLEATSKGEELDVKGGHRVQFKAKKP